MIDSVDGTRELLSKGMHPMTDFGDFVHKAARGLGLPALKCRFGESVGQVGSSNLGGV